jgi:membrane peptidoglycan carboxypeptidase
MKRPLLISGALTAALSLLVALASAWYLSGIIAGLPRLPEDPAELGIRPGTEIYAASGERIFTYNQARRWSSIGQISNYAVQALIATEDAEFYFHRGIDLYGLAGAAWSTLVRGYGSRGGSTLTQQLVKRLFFSPEKTIKRKLSEMLLAIELESLYARTYPGTSRDHRGRLYPAYKDRLIELYLNTVFYGANAYGIADAAFTYFGLEPRQLSQTQAALLVGIVNAPTAYNPLQNPQRASGRLQHVFDRLQRAGYLSDAVRQTLALVRADSLVDPRRPPRNPTPFWAAAVNAEIARRWGAEVLRYGALRIHTTLDLRLQRLAEEAVESSLEGLDARLGFSPYAAADLARRPDYVQAALVSLEPSTGKVRAMVGGRDIFTSHFNRALDARRQPGSGFKPIAYLAALEAGVISPLSLFVDQPRTYTVNRRLWSPRNFGGKYLGLTTAAWALVHSANSTAVQVSESVGATRVAAVARRLGLGDDLVPYRSIALGVHEVSVLQMASAYGALAASGIHVEPSLVWRVFDAAGNELFAHKPAITQVAAPDLAFQTVHLLQQAMDRGTGRGIRRLGFTRPAAGKTGTTNDNTDAWFTGFTPDLATSVWIGFDRRDQNRLVDTDGRQLTGGSGAAPIWARYMIEATAGRPQLDFEPPAGIRIVQVDPFTGTAPSTADTLLAPLKVALRRYDDLNTAADVLEFAASENVKLDTAVFSRLQGQP